MDNEKTLTFKEFAARASKKLEEKKVKRTRRFFYRELDYEIEIRGLSSEEIVECSEYSDSPDVVNKYTIYYASKTLKDLAKYLFEKGLINTHLEIMEVFNIKDIEFLVNQVLDLSGINDKTGFSEVEELKNS